MSEGIFMKMVCMYFSPSRAWITAARGCHPVEIDFESFARPVNVFPKRANEILAWARALPGWTEDSVRIVPLREEIRRSYGSGRMTKEAVAHRYRVDVKIVKRVLGAA